MVPYRHRQSPAPGWDRGRRPTPRAWHTGFGWLYARPLV